MHFLVSSCGLRRVYSSEAASRASRFSLESCFMRRM